MTSVAFSPDGKILASTSDDKTVILWDADLNSWVKLACLIANRSLSPKEWEEIVGAEIEYEPACPDLPVFGDRTYMQSLGHEKTKFLFFSQIDNRSIGTVVPGRILPVGVEEYVGVDGDHPPRPPSDRSRIFSQEAPAVFG